MLARDAAPERGSSDPRKHLLIGLVLAAGTGARLGPLTAEIPKTLLPVAGESTILDQILANLSAAGMDRVAIVCGHRSTAIEDRLDSLGGAHGLALETIHNEKAAVWNNAYSLWCARDLFAAGVLLVNGDCLHPGAVESTMLAAQGPDILLGVDERDRLTGESMKVMLDDEGRVVRLDKAIALESAAGEYIGVTIIEGTAAPGLTDALERTWSSDPSLYYEDAFVEYARAGGEVRIASLGDIDWVEVDDAADLERAREVACRF